MTLSEASRSHQPGRRTARTFGLDIPDKLLAIADEVIRRLTPERWGNRPASLWIAGRFGVLRFRLMVKRGPHMRPQASEGEAQHGLFCWTRRVGQGDERLHCG